METALSILKAGADELKAEDAASGHSREQRLLF
jgi:hypothetical protein